MKPRNFKYIDIQLKDSEDLRDSFGFIQQYRMFAGFYRGNYPSSYQYVYNLFYSIFSSMVGLLYPRNPKLLVRSDDPADRFRVEIIQKISNRWIEDERMKKKFRQIILDICLGGFGVIQVGSGGKFGRSKETVLKQIKRDFPEEFPIDLEEMASPDEYFDEDDEVIWSRRIPPYDILFPVESTLDIHEMRFIAVRYYRLVEHIKKDRRYSGTRSGNFNHVDFSSDEDTSRDLQTSPVQKWGELWDFYDRETGKIYTTVKGLDKVIKREDMVIDRLPFAIMNWTEDPDFAYVPSDARVIYDKQLDTMESDQQERFIRKTIKLLMFVDKNKVDRTELERIMDANDPRDVARVDGPPAQAVSFGKFQYPPDIFRARTEVENDARKEIGFSLNRSGSAHGGRTTAKEAGIIERASSMRSNERIDMMLEGLEDITELANMFRAEMWDTTRNIYVAGLGKINYNRNILFPEGQLKYEAIPYNGRAENFETHRLTLLQAIDRLGAIGTPPQFLMQILSDAFPEVPSISELANLAQQGQGQQQPQQQQDVNQQRGAQRLQRTAQNNT